jgi:hypothetical protein
MLATGSVFAAPLIDFTWTEPLNYENGVVIDQGTDPLTYIASCSGADGGPYTFVVDTLTGSSAVDVDVTSCVGGVPGTYYLVLQAVSSLYNTTSAYSGQASFVVTATDLGNVPNAPVIISITVK